MRVFGLEMAACAVMLGWSAFGESPLLFKSTFDGYNTAPDFAAGAKDAPGGILPDLQMRMDNGEPAMKNVVSLTNPEFISYPLDGNFRPDRGTVSFWLKPANYVLTDVNTFQMFFTATAADYEFYVYKFTQRPNIVLFYLKVGDVQKFVCGKAAWREGEWHKLDVAWDPNGMSIYVDGRLSDQIRNADPIRIPMKLKNGVMALNRQHGFNPTVDGRETAYDNLEIFDRMLTAREIFENYRKVRPEAKPVGVLDAAPEPPRLSYKCVPDERKLLVKLDLWAVELKNRENVPVTLELVDRKTGKTVVCRDVVFKDPDATVDFVFADRLAEGETYDLVAAINGTKTLSKAKFHVPNMDFIERHAGVDNTVPPPWTKVAVVRPGVYSVLDRSYVFDKGVLPTSIVCRGQEMFAKAPRFTLNGREVEWQTPRQLETQDDHVVLAAEGAVQDMKVHGRAELWFDGFCKLAIAFDPGERSAKIDTLQIKWAVPTDAARYLLSPYYRAWTADGRYDGTFGCDEYAQDQLLWTTGVEKGLCWWCESLANWTTDGKKNLHVARQGEHVEVEVDVIDETVWLGKRAEYTMGFTATPVKRPERIDRTRSYSSGGSYGDWSYIGWRVDNNEYAFYNMWNWTSFRPMYPKKFAAYITRRKAEGMEYLVYGMPATISQLDDEWDYFNAVWCRNPYARNGYARKNGKSDAIYFGCGNTSIADWQVGNIENLLKTVPDILGTYYDISDVKFCSNALHGHGGIDAFGKSYSTSTALATRQFFLRTWKVSRRLGKWVHVHAHNKYYPFVHTFANACWPGEEQYYALAKDPANHYLEGIGEEEYQAAWNPVIRGMDVYMIPQNLRASNYGEHAGEVELFMGDRSVTAAMMPSLLYDFKVLGGTFGKGDKLADSVFRMLAGLPLEFAKFHGYWFDPHATVTKGVRTALYTWTKGGDASFLLVVGNTSRTDLKTGLRLDWSKAGRQPSRLRDLMSGRSASEAEWAATNLASHTFLLLVPVTSVPAAD